MHTPVASPHTSGRTTTQKTTTILHRCEQAPHYIRLRDQSRALLALRTALRVVYVVDGRITLHTLTTASCTEHVTHTLRPGGIARNRLVWFRDIQNIKVTEANMATGATVPQWSSMISDLSSSPSAMPHEQLTLNPRHVHTATDRTASHHPTTTMTATSMNTPCQVYPPTMASSTRHTSRCFAGASLVQRRDRDRLHHINNLRLHLYE